MATTGIVVKGTPRVSRPAHIRTTIVLPAALDQNLEIFCTKEARSKNEVVIHALTAALKEAGLEPLRLPKSVQVRVSY